MTLEVLVATMHQTDHSLLEKMNIQSDAIVINQCDRNEIEEFEFRGHRIKWYSFNERGVGLSRNNALMRSSADIILFADDDVVYSDGYEEIITNEFKKHPKYGMIIFDIKSVNKSRPGYCPKKDTRLRWYNSLAYGTYRIAVRREAVLYRNISFSLLFGGGAKYQSGEDSLFIRSCLTKEICGLASVVNVGTVDHNESTWFRGYNKKYFKDKGCLFAALSRNFGGILGLLVLVKSHRRTKEIGFKNAVRFYFQGLREFKKY